MAKVIKPLMSLSAAGALGHTMIFARTTSGTAVRSWHQPSGQPTTAQMDQRQKFINGSIDWKNLDQPTKDYWASIGKLTGVSGYNAFIQSALNAPPQQS